MLPASSLICYSCGLFSLSFAILHACFWHIFDWHTDLQKVRFTNRSIIQIGNLQLIYFFLFVALTCFLFPEELTETDFGRFFMLGMSFFWIGRAIYHFVLLRVRHVLVILLTISFFVGALLFAIPVFYRL